MAEKSSHSYLRLLFQVKSSAHVVSTLGISCVVLKYPAACPGMAGGGGPGRGWGWLLASGVPGLPSHAVLGFMLRWVIILSFLTRSLAFSFCSGPQQLCCQSREKSVVTHRSADCVSSIQVAGLRLEPKVFGSRTMGLSLHHTALWVRRAS